ncbi:hypothetical protein BCEP4_640013 [Burkholderia cepacia]|nr:hypothetical protein BCEP4_640013 [Burkholderia cepacia]
MVLVPEGWLRYDPRASYRRHGSAAGGVQRRVSAPGPVRPAACARDRGGCRRAGADRPRSMGSV